MKKAHTPNPAFADLQALLDIKKQVHVLKLASTRALTYHGFGEMRSPFKTKGLDFQEVRSYQPGDDIRQIDWRITAKHNKPFTKLYTDEKERQVFFLVDMRTCMKFASKGVFKSVLAAQATAFLAFAAENKNDKIGFVVMGAHLIETSLALKGREPVISLLQSLSTASDPQQMPPDETSLTQGLLQLEQAVRRGALVFILSDFSDLTEKATDVIRRLAQYNVCSLIHIYDELETKLPIGYLPITNGDETRFLDTSNTSFNTQYTASFVQLKEHLSKLVQTYQVGYLPLDTQAPVFKVIAAYCQGGFFS